MPLDPTFTTTTTTTTATATTTAARPISPLPHPHHHYPSPQHHHHHHQQQQQPLYPLQQQTQTLLPIRAPTSQLTKPHDPTNPFLYPFTSPGRGFVHKGVRDHVVTVSNPSAGGLYPPPSLVYSHGVRAVASPHVEYLNHSIHLTRPPHLQYPHLSHAPPATASGHLKGVAAASAHPKAAPRSDGNGHKDTSTRERSRDDTFSIVRGRKVRTTEDASLYALCRSWLRNGIHEESQSQQKDVMKALPQPLPASVVASYISNKKDEKDEEEQEENEKSVENLSPQDLLKRHIKRAKRVRARLREERLHRITRYRSRLRLLLPPPIEQFRNDTSAGN